MNEMKEEVFQIAKDVLSRHIKIHQEYCDYFKTVVGNPVFPLELRWNLYMKYGEQYLPISDQAFKAEGIDWDSYSLEEDFYCDKYATLTALDMTLMIDDKLLEQEIEIDDMDLYKESWLKEGIWGFINNW